MIKPTPLEVVEAADVTALSREEQAAALVKGTRSLHALMEDTVCFVIMGQVGKTDIEQAIAATFYRITLLLQGLTCLYDPSQFQMANSVARTVFELVLDVKALCADRSLAAKFFAFSRVVKFRKAEQLVAFLNANPAIDRTPHQHAIQFASDTQRKQEVEQQCIQHWGTNTKGAPNWPDHWSGKSIAERSHNAGPEFEEMYRSEFFLQSQYVHAGPVGIQDLDRDALICSFAIAHQLVQQLSEAAINIVGEEFHLFDTNLELRDKLRRLSAIPGFYAVEAALQKQKVEAESVPNQSPDIGD
jgi:hypothetical protein